MPEDEEDSDSTITDLNFDTKVMVALIFNTRCVVSLSLVVTGGIITHV